MPSSAPPVTNLVNNPYVRPSVAPQMDPSIDTDEPSIDYTTWTRAQELLPVSTPTETKPLSITKRGNLIVTREREPKRVCGPFTNTLRNRFHQLFALDMIIAPLINS